MAPICTHLVDLMPFERLLQDFPVGNADRSAWFDDVAHAQLILVLGVELDLGQGHVLVCKVSGDSEEQVSGRGEEPWQHSRSSATQRTW